MQDPLDDFDTDYYGPKPDAEKAAAIGCLLFAVCLALAIGYGIGKMLFPRFIP